MYSYVIQKCRVECFLLTRSVDKVRTAILGYSSCVQLRKCLPNNLSSMTLIHDEVVFLHQQQQQRQLCSFSHRVTTNN